MQAIVLGSGRSGTNIALEVLAGNKYFTPTVTIEDKLIFLRHGIVYPDGYLSKTDIEYTPFAMFMHVMQMNPNMRIIWTIRDPRDMALSKIYRGRQSEPWAYDATTLGVIGEIYSMFGFFLKAYTIFNNRIYIVRMEDMLRHTELVVKDMCAWLGIEYNDSMPKFYTRMREKTKTYTSIDLGELEKYKRLDTIYDGYFKDKHDEIKLIFDNISIVTQFFGYTNDNNKNPS